MMSQNIIWYNMIYIYIYIWIYYDIHLDLQSALFSAQRSFCLDLRPFRLLMLTRTWKPTSESWRTGIYADFPGKYAPIFCFQSTKCKNALKVVQLRSCGKKTAQKAEISQWAFICVFSRMQSYDDVYAFSSFWTNLVPDSAKNRSNPGQRCRKNLPPKVLTWSVRSALSNLIVPIWVVPGEGIICKTGNG